jgi:transcriptional regulator with XRE-family HTH domain
MIQMSFGKRVRQLRKVKGLTLRGLASQVGVGFTYLSRVETGNMTCGDYPSESLIHRLAETLDGDETELLLLAEKIPEPVRARVLQRPDAFLAFADCDDKTLDKLMTEIGQTPKVSIRKGKSPPRKR